MKINWKPETGNWKLISLIKGDKVIWSVVIIFAFISLLAVYSSSESLIFRFKRGYSEYYLIRQLFVVIAGLVLMYFTHLINYTNYSFIAKIGLLIVIPLSRSHSCLGFRQPLACYTRYRTFVSDIRFCQISPYSVYSPASCKKAGENKRPQIGFYSCNIPYSGCMRINSAGKLLNCSFTVSDLYYTNLCWQK